MEKKLVFKVLCDVASMKQWWLDTSSIRRVGSTINNET